MQTKKMLSLLKQLLFAAILVSCDSIIYAQPAIIVNTSLLEGSDITPDNVYRYQLVNNMGGVRTVSVRGTIKYRNSQLQASYTFTTTLQPGTNSIWQSSFSTPSWVFSTPALKELFFNYHILPQGTYEYCVSVSLNKLNPENAIDDPIGSCIYHTSNDIFLINLITPENDVKIHEYNPMLAWVVNYPFANALTYKIRVAEIKKGQNNENAITRNRPIFREDRVVSTNIMYPATARSLQAFQPYVWTVDAYYKEILLGGAEAWRFTIIEDTLLAKPPGESPFINLRFEKNNTILTNIGDLKLKYQLDEQMTDSISLKLKERSGREIELKQKKWVLNYGDNRLIVPLTEHSLKHMHEYVLEATVSAGTIYTVYFKYGNPKLIDLNEDKK